MPEYKRPKIFISHCSKDKEFVKDLSWQLKYCGCKVWYDDWELQIGDSIVEKVFDGLKASDSLVIVLSKASVESRWVKEELNTAVMKRISENSIKILPVIMEECEIPLALKHIKYADFRNQQNDALIQLLESVAPGHRLWRTLAHLYDHFNDLYDYIKAVQLDEKISDKLLKMNAILESALDMRTELEFRRTRQKIRNLSFFDKIGFLANQGFDVRSQTWNAFVYFHSQMIHKCGNHRANLHILSELLKSRYKTNDDRESILEGISRLKEIMGLICFEEIDLEENYNRYQQWREKANKRLHEDRS